MAEAATVQVSGVSIGDGRNWLVEDVSFRCREGEWTLIFGRSGAGKSTLLRAINGLRPPARGRIVTLGSAIPGRGRREARAVWRQTGTVLQEVALFETRTARGNVEVAVRTVGLGRVAARARATVWLERLGLAGKLDEYPCRLSGGERQRVALARAFAVHPRLLVLDEPTSALDGSTARLVLDAVKEFARRGATVVMSSHRVDEMNGLCDQRIGMAGGRVCEMEPPLGHARAS